APFRYYVVSAWQGLSSGPAQPLENHAALSAADTQAASWDEAVRSAVPLPFEIRLRKQDSHADDFGSHGAFVYRLCAGECGCCHDLVLLSGGHCLPVSGRITAARGRLSAGAMVFCGYYSLRYSDASMYQKIDQQPMVSAVIPAYDEAQTIADVVRVIARHPLIDEVIVIDDGSTDQTAQAAMAAGAFVARFPFN